MEKIFLIAILSPVLIGCSTTTLPVTETHTEDKKEKVVSVKPATEEQVKTCEYLDDIIGTSSFYGVFATKGIKNAKEEAINKATDIGATHIVWKSNSLTYGSTAITGMAYRCLN